AIRGHDDADAQRMDCRPYRDSGRVLEPNVTSSEDRWHGILGELDRRRAFAQSMGGTERLVKHHASAKLDARQRIEALIDPGTFVEIGAFAAGLTEDGGSPAPADGLVAGFGLIDGRPALAGAEDFTVQAGSIG